MALPTSRNRTYIAGTPVKSADLNDIQDAIISGNHGDLKIQVSAAEARPKAETGWTLADGTWPTTQLATAASSKLCFPIPVAVGDRLKSLKVYLQNSTTQLAVDVIKSVAGTNVQSTVANTGATIGTNSLQHVDLDVYSADQVVVPGTFYFAVVTSAASAYATQRAFGLEAVVARG